MIRRSRSETAPACGTWSAAILLIVLAGTGCGSVPPREGEPPGEPRSETRFMIPPLVHHARWKPDGHFFYLLPLLYLDFRGTEEDAARYSPWVILPPILYMNYDRGVDQQKHIIFPFGRTYSRSANEESETVLFPIWHSRTTRRWIRLAEDEYREVPSRSWGVFPLFSVKKEGGVTQSLTIWPLLSRYERQGRKRIFRLFFLIPIPLGEETLEEAIRSDTPKIRWDAADEIGDLRDRSRIPLLLEAMQSDDRVLRFRAHRALERITGQDFDYNPDAPPERRQARIEKAREWIREREERR